MAEFIFMKSLKYLLAFLCYFGTGVVAIDEITQGAVKRTLEMSPAAHHIVLYLLVIFWVLKIAWFVWEKFWLETRERNQRMQIEKGANAPNPMPYLTKIDNEDDI
jgi:hypothetical protein